MISQKLLCRCVSRRGIFHSSWFDSADLKLNVVTKAPSEDDITCQIAFFKANGFTIIRNRNADITKFALLNQDVLNTYQAVKSTFLYKIWRYFNHVRAPESRHSIPLRSSKLLIEVLSSIMIYAKPIFETQLPSNSMLVDLSTMLSLPGSVRQKTHSDIPYSDNDHIISCLVALSPVEIQNGPTYLYAGSHTKAFHSRYVSNSAPAAGDRDIFEPYHYASDGSNSSEFDLAETESADYKNRMTMRKDYTETVADTIAVDKTSASPPLAAVLNTGDILMYDTKLFHYGSANLSATPRALLAFSFQSCTPWGSVERVNGFTYHCHPSVSGLFRLESFQ